MNEPSRFCFLKQRNYAELNTNSLFFFLKDAFSGIIKEYDQVAKNQTINVQYKPKS